MVTIDGKGSRSVQKSGAVAGTAAVVPAGSTRLVACGAGAAAALAELGDPQASGDAAMCATWIEGCRQSGPVANPAMSAAVRVMKQADGSWSLNGAVCQLPATAQVSAALVREQVARLVPGAGIGMAPQGTTLVNIQTILWVATATQRTLAPIRILGRQVVVTLRLEHVRWDFGDGSTDSAATPGNAYDEANDPCASVDCPDYYGHTYARTGTMSVTAQVSWVASFTVNGAGPLVIPGTVSGPAARTAVQVRQARGVLVPDPTST